jgi:DNA gyrase subunit B
MQESEQLSPIEAVRKRPGMYVGSPGFFGLVNYLVCPFNLNLSAGAKRISAAVSDGGFRIDSDVAIQVVDSVDGLLRPFEALSIGGHGLDGCILAALSENLEVTTSHDGLRRTLAYSRGDLRSDVEQAGDESDFTSFTFSPDPTIFTVLNLSPSVFDSYLRRMSYLHPEVKFQLGVGKDLTDHYSENGLPDLFRAITSPYQQPVGLSTSPTGLFPEVGAGTESVAAGWRGFRVIRQFGSLPGSWKCPGGRMLAARAWPDGPRQAGVSRAPSPKRRLRL